MKTPRYLTPLFLLLTMSQMINATPLGFFDEHQDVGNPNLSGSVEYDSHTQSYTISGAGKNMWFGEDEFHFLWKKIKGDFIVQASVEFVGDGVDAHRKLGIIAKESMSKTAAHANISVHGDTLTSLQYREKDAEDTQEVVLEVYHPTEIQFERRGDLFIASAAVFGETYKSVEQKLPLKDDLYVGLYVCSHREDVIEKAIFKNVRVTIPADEDFVPYQDYIGSHLEVMDIDTGKRQILHSENRSLQAPNWTPDNQFLIYNADGKLYRYSLETSKIEELNTGKQIQNNNDHVLSWGGSQIAISNHDGENSISTIYILPTEGSTNPKKISDSENGHSYLHGWSPDNSSIIFTGQRNDQFDIWSIDIATGVETQLTNEPTLDDASEYTPDGKWIYFNSVRTGTMQIWRMRPDGSGQEQITYDRFNNWFPHISPDGKWIIYLSFPEDIDPSDHPFYKQVYLRLMPASGGVPKTIAYIYGGQGTINVPSWSPDSQSVAFVSNTKM